MERLQEKYKKEVIPQMIEKFGYKSLMAVPVIKKVVVNTCFGKQTVNKIGTEREKLVEAIIKDLSLITGQKPKIIKAKKSIAAFKLRKGLEIAAMITLRRKRMWDFLERLIYIALPRSRDFKGIPPDSIDEKGNLSIGIKEHIIFPEVFTEKEKTIFGLEVSIVLNAKSKEEGLTLYKLLGFPIKE